jgi:two-component system sensor histidine kinase/response regulator
VEAVTAIVAISCAGALGLLGGALLARRRRSGGSCHIAQSLTVAAHRLGADEGEVPAIRDALATVGAALGLARLELHAVHHPPGDGLPLSSLRHAWAAPGVPERSSDPHLRDRPWHPQRSRWLAELSAGRGLAAALADLPADERIGLDGVVVLLEPVTIEGRLWGYLQGSGSGRICEETQTGLRLFAEIAAAGLARSQAAQVLASARAEAASGDRAKREFLANISHEVRTPLNGVLGMSGLLLDTELDVRQREYAQVVRSSAENLLALLNDLIDLAKAEGEQRAERTRFDPVRLAEDVVAMLAERAHTKGVEIAVHPADGLPRRVTGDAARLRQVLVNLVGNAIKFTVRGHVVVRVDWDSGEMLTFVVSDTGIGIDSEAQGRLFAVFTQGDGSTTRRYGGTGLGLAICKRQVDVMGGTVACRSSPGQGSSFTVRVPAPEGSSAAAGRSSLIPSALLGARVLVVEPESTVRAAFAAVCRRIGLVTEEVAGCAEAETRLAAVGVETPRLVLVSANLPGASDLPRRLPVGTRCVLLAPVGRRPTQTDVIRRGFSVCLVKPPRTARLAEAVHRALGRDQEDSSVDTGTHHRRTALRVLVVEDDAVNQRLVKAVLEREGMLADLASDGLEALEALTRAHYDVVLLDLLMPVMDGFTCATEIRRLERERGQPPIPILAVSALDEPAVTERCRQAGIDGQLRKPFEPKHLRRLLRRLLQKRALAAGA